MKQPAGRRKGRPVSASNRTKRVKRTLSKQKKAVRGSKLGRAKGINRRRTRERSRKKSTSRKLSGYNQAFDQSYNEGYNAGFAKGFEDGHQLAYEQQP
ncbi:hypothetical protein ACFPYJ_02815 [Paenibacillus solisilvae]|uniref:Uncharacterized protein n=1 Tax=Paenibacillus solisilvae TaxID=2486751 RepID=A0ABW0VT69_9BACL